MENRNSNFLGKTTNFMDGKIFEKVYRVVKSIPKGKVLTYKIVAQVSGTDPRIVGFALHANKFPDIIPCHRVVKNNGTIANGYAFGGIKKQREKLIKEGVVFINLKTVDLDYSLYKMPFWKKYF